MVFGKRRHQCEHLKRPKRVRHRQTAGSLVLSWKHPAGRVITLERGCRGLDASSCPLAARGWSMRGGGATQNRATGIDVMRKDSSDQTLCGAKGAGATLAGCSVRYVGLRLRTRKGRNPAVGRYATGPLPRCDPQLHPASPQVQGSCRNTRLDLCRVRGTAAADRRTGGSAKADKGERNSWL